jgi:hypothetical protein
VPLESRDCATSRSFSVRNLAVETEFGSSSNAMKPISTVSKPRKGIIQLILRHLTANIPSIIIILLKSANLDLDELGKLILDAGGQRRIEEGLHSKSCPV